MKTTPTTIILLFSIVCISALKAQNTHLVDAEFKDTIFSINN